MPQDLRDMATAVARAVLEERWAADRFELELESEHDAQWNHLFDRSHYAASFRVFELADTARVALAPAGHVTGVRLPAGALDVLEPCRRPRELTAEEVARVRHAAEDAGRRAGRWQTLRSKVATLVEPASGESGAMDVIVRLYASAPEGSLTVDLDAVTGERLGYFAPCFLRGSRGGRTLSQREAQARVEEAGAVPRGLRVGRAELEEPLGARLWKLRFEASDLEQTGALVVCAHARSGAVVGMTSTLRTRVRLGRGPSRERAHDLVTKALPFLLGPDALLASLVPGAIVGRGSPRTGWVGTALTAEGVVVRVSFAGDEVEARVEGKLVRARVGPEHVSLVSRRRSGSPGLIPREASEAAPEPVAAV